MNRPGHSVRACPACKQPANTWREPVDDDRREVVFYEQHPDGSGRECVMSGREAALRAVAFTGVAA